MTELFKKDSKGKIRILRVYTEGADLVQEGGIYEGALVPHRKTCKGKNIGRSNETTPEQQAQSEMESKITEKLKEDYFRTIEEAENTLVILPMLAKDYKDHHKKIDWDNTDIFVQPKLDGMRALGTTGPGATLTSREGSPILTMEHIIRALEQLPPGNILDGELYAHGKSFQQNMRLIKKYRENESEAVKFHNYDLVSELPFSERLDIVAERWGISTDKIELVDTIKITTEEQLKRAHALNLLSGYEGSIVRWGNQPYKVNGRSENLLKYKDFQDLALPIIDIIPAEQRPEWGIPVYELKGKRFNSGMKFSHEERKEWLVNKDNYIGKTGEIRFFEYTEDGIPRFPVTVGVRLDK